MAKINKLTKGGQTIYPATTTDAVVHPTTRKNLTEELTELHKRILDETKRAQAAEEANATAIEALANELEALGACGFARVNGSADPDAQVTFGNTSKLRSLASHLHLGVFKNGKLLMCTGKTYSICRWQEYCHRRDRWRRNELHRLRFVLLTHHHAIYATGRYGRGI